jgi:hypothetical protein
MLFGLFKDAIDKMPGLTEIVFRFGQRLPVDFILRCNIAKLLSDDIYQ